MVFALVRVAGKPSFLATMASNLVCVYGGEGESSLSLEVYLSRASLFLESCQAHCSQCSLYLLLGGCAIG